MSASNIAPTAPALVRMAQGAITAGTPWRQAAEHIKAAAAGDHESLQLAVRCWLGVMRRGPSDDFAAGSVLRALERALASTPRHEMVSETTT